MVGAEMPMTSDQVVWSEQNRLHVSYDTAVVGTTGTVVTITLPAGNQGATDDCAIRVGQTVVVSDGINTVKAKVRTVANSGAAGSRVAAVTVDTYQVAQLNAGGLADTTAVKIFVYGSEFAKGTEGMDAAIEPNFTQFNNKPIILKDFYEVSGSDAAQIGWVEVATEDGTSGYMWYLKAESETRLRFEDYLEMSMVEAEKKGANGAAQLATDKTEGSEGLFAAIEDRGNVYNDFAGAAAPGSGALGDFDAILKQLDKQGAIEENMLFLSRATALDFDDMIAAHEWWRLCFNWCCFLRFIQQRRRYGS